MYLYNKQCRKVQRTLPFKPTIIRGYESLNLVLLRSLSDVIEESAPATHNRDGHFQAQLAKQCNRSISKYSHLDDVAVAAIKPFSRLERFPVVVILAFYGRWPRFRFRWWPSLSRRLSLLFCMRVRGCT
jgi:hypothetical protein